MSPENPDSPQPPTGSEPTAAESLVDLPVPYPPSHMVRPDMPPVPPVQAPGASVAFPGFYLGRIRISLAFVLLVLTVAVVLFVVLR
jgi:hypothetical protein